MPVVLRTVCGALSVPLTLGLISAPGHAQPATSSLRPSPRPSDAPPLTPRPVPAPSFTITVYPLRIAMMRVSFPRAGRAVARWSESKNAVAYRVRVRMVGGTAVEKLTRKRLVRLRVEPGKGYVVKVRGVNDAGAGRVTTRRFTAQG